MASVLALASMQYPLYIIGKNNNDTTAYLRRLFLEHIREGKGGAYFDFSGNLTGLLQHIPDNLDPLLFFPMDTDYPIGLNPLYRPSDRRTALENIVNAFRSVWPSDIATTRIDLYLKAAILSLLDMPTATLLGVSELFTNDEYRTKVIGHLKDPVLKPFWDRYESMSVKDRLTFTESTVTRAFTFSIDPLVRNILGQKKTTFTVKDTYVIIASFPQELGSEMGNFLATLLLSQLPDGMLTVLDDGHRIGTSAVRAALPRLDIAFSHQYGAQLRDGLRETLIGTAATIVAFSTGTNDSRRLSPEIGIVQEQEMLHYMARGRYRIRGPGEDARHEETSVSIDLPTFDPDKIINRSRNLYTTPRSEVEESIAAFYSPVDRPKKRRSKSRNNQ